MTEQSTNQHPATHDEPRRRPITRTAIAFLAGLAVCGLAAGTLSGCGGNTGGNRTSAAAARQTTDSCDTTINVVASVNQWGSLAQQLGGSCVNVTSIINSTATDPHDYETTPADLTKLARADVVVLNGAGYDGWAQKAQLDEGRQRIVKASSLMGIADSQDDHDHDHDHEEGKGHHHHHGTVNPHLWFSPAAVLKMSEAITSAYVAKAGETSDTAATARRHSNTWNAEYAEYTALVNRARAKNLQRRYVATESIIGHLLDYIGATDKTPDSYTNAMNNDAEPSASDLKNALDTVRSSNVDMLIVNPQEMGGFAKKLDAAARESGKTIISVTEQLPENQKTLLGWITTITNQALADDSQHGWFLTQQVKDRTIADYAGQWRSVYPLLKNGKLRGVMEHKAATGDKTADEYTAYYDAGYKTDTETITIEGDRMTFTTNGRKVTATYRYDGHRILDYAKGNRGVRYLFTATGDVSQGAPKAVQFSDHGIAPGKAAHFHIFTGDSHDEVIKQMEHWPTYYPASMSDDEIVKEMLAH